MHRTLAFNQVSGLLGSTAGSGIARLEEMATKNPRKLQGKIP
jgi:hypothetical protein